MQLKISEFGSCDRDANTLLKQQPTTTDNNQCSSTVQHTRTLAHRPTLQPTNHPASLSAFTRHTQLCALHRFYSSIAILAMARFSHRLGILF